MEDLEASFLAMDSSGHSVATFVSDDEETKSTSDQVLAMMISSFSSDCRHEQEEMSADQFASISSKSSRVIRNGSTKSPVCVSSFVDNIVNDDFWEDDEFGNKSILNNIDDDTMDFVDPDKLEEAISKLCDPILEKKSQEGVPPALAVHKKAPMKYVRQYKTLVPTCIHFSGVDRRDDDYSYDAKSTMKCVTPDQQNSFSDLEVPMTPALPVPRRELFPAVMSKEENHYNYSLNYDRTSSPRPESTLAPMMPLAAISSGEFSLSFERKPSTTRLLYKKSMNDMYNHYIPARPQFLPAVSKTEVAIHTQLSPDAVGSSISADKRSFPKETKAVYVPNKLESWDRYYLAAKAFRKAHGHCLIPYKYPQDPGLAKWCKRQRYQYTLYKRRNSNKMGKWEKSSSLNKSRIQALDDIGFVWDIHEAMWEKRLCLFREYKKKNGHGLVPKGAREGGLGRWVGSQRHLLMKGSMSVERFLKLQEVEFVWSTSSTQTKEIMAALGAMKTRAAQCKRT